jgi:hypothetical protein
MSLNESEIKLDKLLLHLNLKYDYDEDGDEFQIKREEFDAKFLSRIKMYLCVIENKKLFVQKCDYVNAMFIYIEENLENIGYYELVQKYKPLLMVVYTKLEEFINICNTKNFDINDFDEYNSLVKSRELRRTLTILKEDILFDRIVNY